MTKDDRPLSASMGDEAQEIWGELPRLPQSPCRGPTFRDDRCQRLVGDLQLPEVDEGDVRYPRGDDLSGSVLGLDLNAGIARYLASPEASGPSAKDRRSQRETRPEVDVRGQSSCSMPAAAG
ncbi:unnamed protein product [Symbiodinium natans]|uniref:Uncharacterized protein n=1 Tax=Symbiodinium natans TaxID=878477 RepID=A0A812K567_9DINO|nr:unnamed protein product [Symbiodinium natans]